jgi:hypothetical protein
VANRRERARNRQRHRRDRRPGRRLGDDHGLHRLGVASGALSLTHALQLRGTPDAWFLGFGGALSLILGILIVASLPSSASAI